MIFQQRAQLFCLDVRCSLPLMEEIPVLVTCCFFTVRNYFCWCVFVVKELDDILFVFLFVFLFLVLSDSIFL